MPRKHKSFMGIIIGDSVCEPRGKKESVLLFAYSSPSPVGAPVNKGKKSQKTRKQCFSPLSPIYY